MSIKEQIEARLGKTVTVEVTSMSANPHAPKTVQYRGDILRSERWDPPETFRMTGNKEFPTRVIGFGIVLKINGAEMIQGAKTSDENIVRILSSKKDKEYVVVINTNGKHTCDCPGYGFRKTCSHIGQALDKVGKG